MSKHFSQGLTPYAVHSLSYPRNLALRHANPQPSPEVPVTFRWRCCKCPPPLPPRPFPSSRLGTASPLPPFSLSIGPQPTSLPPYNALTTATHFNVHAHPDGHYHVLVPGYYGQECKKCEHRACDTCGFLEVGGEHAVEMLDRGAGLRTVREGVDIWGKIGLSVES